MKYMDIIFSLFLSAILLISSNYFSRNFIQPAITLSKQETALNLNDKFLRYISFGHIRLLVDFMWIETLMNSDLEHHRSERLDNWLYIRFDTIAKLDPYFLENYIYGGQYLAIIKDDVYGAKDLFDRGIMIYNDNYYLNFYGGYNDLIELHDFDNAFTKLNRIKNSPFAPSFIKTVVAKIKADQGDLETAFTMVKESYLKSPKNSDLQKNYFKTLNFIKIDLDLICLNSKKLNCSQTDLNGIRYVKNNNLYIYPFPYRKFAFKKIKEKSKL